MMVNAKTILTIVTAVTLVSLFLLTYMFERTYVKTVHYTESVNQEPQVTKPICMSKKNLSNVQNLLCVEHPPFMPEYKNPCWRNVNGQLRCLPYFMLVGMDKSGSSDLFDRITKHPDILGNSGILGKETWWWSWMRYGFDLMKAVKIRNFEDYLNFFNNSTRVIDSPAKTDKDGFHFAIAGDGTPMDAWDFRGWTQIPQNNGLKEPKVLTPDLVYHVNKNVKLIIIMRDPIERLYSDYYFLDLADKSSLAFHSSVVTSIAVLEKCLRAKSMLTCLSDRKNHLAWNKAARIHVGFYSEYIKQWLRVFPREQILFLRTEDYSADIGSHMDQVFHFLGTRPLTSSEMTSYGIDLKVKKHVTKSKLKKGPMLEKTRALLSSLYDPYNRKLAEILKDDRFLWKDQRSKNCKLQGKVTC